MLASIFLHSCDCSHDADLVGDVEGILVRAESNVSFLLASWSVKSVNFLDLDLVELLACLSDHLLVSSLVDNEDESVVILNSLDGGFTGKWVLNNSESVEGVVCSDGSEENLGRSLLNGGLWSSEGDLGPDFALLSSVSSLLNCSRGGFSGLSFGFLKATLVQTLLF